MRSFFSALVDLFSAPSFSSIAHASSADDFSGGLFSDDSGGPSGLVGTVGRRLLDEGINPATGLPMIGCVDVAGNPYGADLQAAPRSGLHDHAHHDDHSWHVREPVLEQRRVVVEP